MVTFSKVFGTDLGRYEANNTKPRSARTSPRDARSASDGLQAPRSREEFTPLIQAGTTSIIRGYKVEGIICDTLRSFVRFHMGVCALRIHSRLAGQEPALVRSHQVVSAQYTVPVSWISVGLIS